MTHQPYDTEWHPFDDFPDALADPLEADDPTTYRVSLTDDDFGRIAAVWGVMAACPDHTFQVVGEPERMLEFFGWLDRQAHKVKAENEPGELDTYKLHIIWDAVNGQRGMARQAGLGTDWPLPSVWLGTTLHSDAYYARLWDLVDLPAAGHFLVAEPRDEMDFGEQMRSLDWLHLRAPINSPVRLSWLRSLVKQAQEADVPCWVDRLGSEVTERLRSFDAPTGVDESLDLDHPTGADTSEWPEDLRVREMLEVE